MILAGDFNSHTFDRGHWWARSSGATVLVATPAAPLRRRLLHPDRGAAREPLFDALRESGFEWEPLRRPSADAGASLRPAARGPRAARAAARCVRCCAGSRRRAHLRLDWFAGRGWRDGRGATVRGLDGPGLASDHAPLVARSSGKVAASLAPDAPSSVDPCPCPHRNTLAIVGAGPVGLEAAARRARRRLRRPRLRARRRRLARARLGPRAHVHAVAHESGPASRARLDALRLERAAPPTRPPTGRELAERYLAAAGARCPSWRRASTLTRGRAHRTPQGCSRATPGRAAAREHPFRLMVRDPGGRESFLHAFALIDASGVYGQPNWAGDGGIPARNELYLAPQLSYHLDDVLGLRRERYAGQRSAGDRRGDSAAPRWSSTGAARGGGAGHPCGLGRRANPPRCCTPRADDPLSERRASTRGPGRWPGRDPVGDATWAACGGRRLRVQLRDPPLSRRADAPATQKPGRGGRAGDRQRRLRTRRLALPRAPDLTRCYATRGSMRWHGDRHERGRLPDRPAAVAVDTRASRARLLHPRPQVVRALAHFLLETGYRQVART